MRLITGLFHGGSSPHWHCTCGEVNPVTRTRCWSCKRW